MANRLNEELEEFDLIPLRGAHKSYAMHIYVPGFTRDEHDLLHAWGAKDNQYTAVIPERATWAWRLNATPTAASS